MALTFFTVPVLSIQESQDQLNQFLAQNKVIEVDKQLVDRGENSFWAICVTTANDQSRKFSEIKKTKRNVVDYKKLLSEDDFTIYLRLRSLRKTISDEEAVPAYAVFTNEQMAKMITQRVSTVSDLLAIDGIGQGKVDKYSEQFLELLQSLLNDSVQE